MKEQFQNKKVYHYTVGRSGSTLISQILRDLFGDEKVQAGHEPVLLHSFVNNRMRPYLEQRGYSV